MASGHSGLSTYSCSYVRKDIRKVTPAQKGTTQFDHPLPPRMIPASRQTHDWISKSRNQRVVASMHLWPLAVMQTREESKFIPGTSPEYSGGEIIWGKGRKSELEHIL